ncbi:DNA methyltransferase [Mesorhizobium sp.]|uniref:DNA methyltransferase n=1 Tax=Mesorhizobium sp. TaxID=1871066 RepID=UPI0025B83872|nr:DNA methyltransferase [Mesorhizobium sp.]
MDSLTNSPSAAGSLSGKLVFPADRFDRLTHYAFRYPAKFHPPVVRALIERYSKRGDVCLDPFNGSGTLQVEAMTLGRNSVGFDIDPLAVFVSEAKTRVHDVEKLAVRSDEILSAIKKLRELNPKNDQHLLNDIPDQAFNDIVLREGLSVPQIPKIKHWFRNICILQLARIKKVIDGLAFDSHQKGFFLLCFASIIRNSSNADPTPVSGLEVTAHMRRLEAEGRKIDVLSLFEKAVRTNLLGAKAFSVAAHQGTWANSEVRDARRAAFPPVSVDVVITSPPYHNAVDYYRRHQLEMFWLGLANSAKERQDLLPGYIGRHNVPQALKFEQTPALPTVAGHWERVMRDVKPRRADDFLHYFWSMSAVFGQLNTLLPKGGKAVFVVGNSQFQGEQIPTTDIFQEMAAGRFSHVETLWYPIKNRYMSYKRRNGADIDTEYVLVFSNR